MNIVIELNYGPSLGLAAYSSAPAGVFPWYIPERLTHANSNVCLYAGEPNNANNTAKPKCKSCHTRDMLPSNAGVTVPSRCHQ